jgi:hypothetical protein
MDIAEHTARRSEQSAEDRAATMCCHWTAAAPRHMAQRAQGEVQTDRAIDRQGNILSGRFVE